MKVSALFQHFCLILAVEYYSRDLISTEMKAMLLTELYRYGRGSVMLVSASSRQFWLIPTVEYYNRDLISTEMVAMADMNYHMSNR